MLRRDIQQRTVSFAIDCKFQYQMLILVTTSSKQQLGLKTKTTLPHKVQTSKKLDFRILFDFLSSSYA